jgi:predicted transcriptional regulator
LRKPRNKIEIYYDILNAINLESNNGVVPKPTRIQVHSKLAYDKLDRYLNELEINKMILQNPLRMTEKGRDFLQSYDCALNESKVPRYFGFTSLIFLLLFSLPIY